MYHIQINRPVQETFSFLKCENYASMLCAELHLNTYGRMNCICKLCNEIIEFTDLLLHIKEHFLCHPFECQKCKDTFTELDIFMNHLCRNNESKDIDSMKIVSISSILNSNEDVTLIMEQSLKDIENNYKIESKINAEYKSSESLPLSSVESNHLSQILIDKKMSPPSSSTALSFLPVSPTQSPVPLKSTIVNSKLFTPIKEKRPKEKRLKEICEICGMIFNAKSFSVHRLVHATNLPDFICDLCNKTFNTREKIRLHMRTHTSEKPYACSFCGFKCRTQGRVNQHEKIHKEGKYACTLCHRKFPNSQRLKKHNLVHTGEKPYECDICGVFFRTTAHRQSHRRLHTGEKPYKCQHCDKAFPQLAGLFCHLKLHKKHGVIS